MTLPSVTNSEARAQTTLVVPNASGGEPSAGRFDIFLVAVASAALSIISLVYYFRHGELLLYGDAVAHINIARRIFDSLTPGFGQLGTVWLPLPHLLIAPFIVNHAMWRSGIGAAIPSMMAYVLGAVGIYRLTRRTLKNAQATESVARLGGFLAAALFAANPSLRSDCSIPRGREGPKEPTAPPLRSEGPSDRRSHRSWYRPPDR